MIRSVAFVTNGALSLTNFRGTLIRRLVEDGVRVWGVAPDFDEAHRERLRALGAEPVDVPMARAAGNPVRELADMVAMWRVLRRLRPDAVLSYFAKPVVYGTLAAAAARVPRRVAMIEGLGYAFADDVAGWRRRLLRDATRRLLGAAMHRAHHVVFLNPVDAADFVEQRLVDAAKLTVLGGIGVDLDLYRASPPPVAPVQFVLMARLLREKGIEDFAEAARRVGHDRPATRFVLLGDVDPNPSALSRAQVQSLCAAAGIEWHGHVGDVRPWIKASSVVVLPSYYREGVPRSLQEAAAMGRPIITTDNVGCRDTVEDGVTGRLVPMRDPAALADAMRWFVDNPEAIAAMGAAGRTLAEQQFDASAKDALLHRLLAN